MFGLVESLIALTILAITSSQLLLLIAFARIQSDHSLQKVVTCIAKKTNTDWHELSKTL